MERIIDAKRAKIAVENLMLDPAVYGITNSKKAYAEAYNDAIRDAIDAVEDTPTFKKRPNPAATKRGQRLVLTNGEDKMEEVATEALKRFHETLYGFDPEYLKERDRSMLREIEIICTADNVCMDIYGIDDEGRQVGSKFTKKLFLWR